MNGFDSSGHERVMMNAKSLILNVALALSLGLLHYASCARAEENSVDGSAPSGTVPSRALRVRLSLEGSGLDAPALVAALERELGVAIEEVSSAGELELVVSRERLVAICERTDGRSVARELALPMDGERRLATIALVAGNLVRDEAGPLLAELHPRKTAPEASVPVAPAAVAPVPVPAEESVEASGSEAAPLVASEVGEDSDDADDGWAEDEALPEMPQAPLNFTLFSPVSTHPDLWSREVGFSFGALWTDLGRLRGFALSGLALSNRQGGRGFQLAGLWSGSFGRTRGATIAGLVSNAEGGLAGLQLAGLVAHQSADLRGAQLSLVTTAGEAAHGAQIGLVNHAGSDVVGVQIGLVNVSGGKVRGAQIGLINIGRGLVGANVGLVNINPDVLPEAIAWASIRPRLGGSSDFSGPVMAHAALKYRMGHFYTLAGLGIGSLAACPQSEPDCEDAAVLAPGVGFGAHFDVSEALYVEVDNYYQWEHSTRSGRGGTSATLLRGAVGVRLLPQLALFGGTGPRMDLEPDRGDPTFSPHFFAGLQLF